MDEKTPLQAAIIGYCLTFTIYSFALNSGGFTGWALNFIVPAVVSAAAYFGLKKMV